MPDALLQVDDLQTVFGREGRGPVARAVRGVSFGVRKGETLGIVGGEWVGVETVTV